MGWVPQFLATTQPMPATPKRPAVQPPRPFTLPPLCPAPASPNTLPPGAQVTVHIKGRTECFECSAKPAPKTYPICTLRNTPDKPIHTIVWAKDLLFNRLFGAPDAVSGERTGGFKSEPIHLERKQ